MVGRINTIGDVIGLAKFIQIQFSQVLSIINAIREELLAVLVYGRYDYIGYRHAKFLKVNKGEARVIPKILTI